MDTPFTKATETKRRLKLLMYGPPKVGKTLTALALPKPVVLDMEHGSDAYADRFEFDVLHTISTSEVKQAVEWLSGNRGQYQTVIIDPITVWWEALQTVRYEIGERKAVAAKRPADNVDLAFADWNKMKLAWNGACAKLVNAGYHLVAIARQADLYEGEGLNLKKVGVKPAADKGAPYWFDTVVRVEFRGDDRVAVIEGDRWDIMAGQRVVPLDEFVEAIRVHAEETLDAPAVQEPEPGEVLKQDVMETEEAESQRQEISKKMDRLSVCPHDGSVLKEIGPGVSKSTGKPYHFWTCSKSGCGYTLDPEAYQEAIAGKSHTAHTPPPAKEKVGEVPCPKCKGDLREKSGKFAGPAGKPWHSWHCSKCNETVSDEKYQQLIVGRGRAEEAQNASDPFANQG